MSNRNLSTEELAAANKLLDEIRRKLAALSNGDKQLLFAYRRKIYKELTYDERGKPAHRNQLKAFKRGEQGGLCPLCSKPLPEKNAVLDRFDAATGYTRENTRLICEQCDRANQTAHGFK